jgi:hypothetical protein
LQEIAQGVAVQLKYRAGQLLTREDQPRLGLDLLGGEGHVKNVLAAFDIFTVWWLVVVTLGFIVLTRRKASQVVPPVLAAGIAWLILMAVLDSN